MVSRIAELMEREEAALRSLVSTKRCSICTANARFPREKDFSSYKHAADSFVAPFSEKASSSRKQNPLGYNFGDGRAIR